MCLVTYALSLGLDAAAQATVRFGPALAVGAYNVPMDEVKTSVTQTPSVAPVRPEDGLDALIARIARRDETALEQLYDATAARTYALARRITRDTRAAEEVVSDVYFQVWQQAECYDPGRGRVLTWLLTICRSRALDHLRRRDPADAHPAPDNLRPDLYRDDEGPLDLLLAFERSSRVHAALGALSDRERRLVRLAYFEGMSHQEIAAHTGMPLGSVKSVLRRACQGMRAQCGLAALAPEEIT